MAHDTSGMIGHLESWKTTSFHSRGFPWLSCPEVQLGIECCSSQFLSNCIFHLENQGIRKFMGKSQSDLVGVLTGDRWLQEVWHISSELAYLWVLSILPFSFCISFHSRNRIC